MALTAPERETTINWSDDCETITISTSQRKIVTQLLNNPVATIESDTIFEGTRIIKASLPLGAITIRKAAKGTIRRSDAGKRTLPENAPRCTGTKANGEKCNSLAKGGTQFCVKHQNQS